MTPKHRVALITGGRRIGQIVARELAARGVDVALSYRGSKEEANQTAGEVTALGRRAAVIAADVGKAADCQALVEGTVAELGRLDILVNMASIYEGKPFDDTDERDWQRNMDVNVRSVFLCARAAVPYMRRLGGGRIINFADWVSRSGRPAFTGFAAHYTSKAAVIALTEALALELAADQILVNAVAPGPILPSAGMSDEDIRATAEAIPVKRWGGEIEVARTVLALIESDFITGETIRVDGGRHLQ
jgi:NAD(P)-dependent dehydrogenase (short-subunit alcohol dehydrogenase family)